MKKIFIIVLNFNGGKEILACLQALYLIKVPSGWARKMVVVDNNVNPTSSRKAGLRGDKILRNFKNLGFAAGMDVGIRYALKNGAEAVMLLNQDTEVKKDFLKPLINNPADIVAPVIKFRRGGKWVYDFGGKVNWWTGRTTHLESFHLGGVMASLRSACHHPRCMLFPDYVSGCAMLIRRPVLEKIGLLDERFFLYFEDTDFCLRAKKAGFKIAVDTQSVILHYLSPTKKKPLWQNWQLLKSNLIFINRWISWWRRPIAYFYWLVLAIKILFK